MPNCSAHEGVARAAEDLTVVRRLLELGVPTTWPTVFPIHYHYWMTNRMLELDARCQRERVAELRKSVPTAQNRSLQLLDLWARVGSGQLAVRPKDWHLRVESFRSLARRLLHSLD